MGFFGNAKMQARMGKQMLKDSGFKRPDHYDYVLEGDKIMIDCKGDAVLAERILSSLDSSIEWGLRMTR